MAQVEYGHFGLYSDTYVQQKPDKERMEEFLKHSGFLLSQRQLSHLNTLEMQLELTSGKGILSTEDFIKQTYSRLWGTGEIQDGGLETKLMPKGWHALSVTSMESLDCTLISMTLCS